MSRFDLRHRFAVTVMLILAACSGGDADPVLELPPDAAPPADAAPPLLSGRFTLISELALAIPAEVEPVLATLTDATDGPDDPTRYLIDHMIATLPDGTLKSIAIGAAPYLAAYVQARIADVAPRLAPGLTALAGGLVRVATHLGTTETLRVDSAGDALRTITGVRFTLGATPTTVRFADHGLPDIAVGTRLTRDAAGHVTLAAHSHALPYGALLRLGLDHAVVPSVVPTADDLAGALTALVDCNALGAIVGDHLGAGLAALYTTACTTALTTLASELDARLATVADLTLTVAGAADALDLDHDRAIDELRNGGWTAPGVVTAFRAGSFTARTAP